MISWKTPALSSLLAGLSFERPSAHSLIPAKPNSRLLPLTHCSRGRRRAKEEGSASAVEAVCQWVQAKRDFAPSETGAPAFARGFLGQLARAAATNGQGARAREAFLVALGEEGENQPLLESGIMAMSVGDGADVDEVQRLLERLAEARGKGDRGRMRAIDVIQLGQMIAACESPSAVQTFLLALARSGACKSMDTVAIACSAAMKDLRLRGVGKGAAAVFRWAKDELGLPMITGIRANYVLALSYGGERELARKEARAILSLSNVKKPEVSAALQGLSVLRDWHAFFDGLANLHKISPESAQDQDLWNNAIYWVSARHGLRALRKAFIMMQNRGVEPDAQSYSLFLSSLFDEPWSKVVREVVDECKRKGIGVNGHGLKGAVRAVALAEGPGEAYEMHEELRMAGSETNAKTLMSALQVMKEKSSPDYALRLFEEYRERGLEPDLRLWATLIATFATRADGDGAWAQLRRMRSTGLAPNTYAFGAVMTALAGEGRYEDVCYLARDARDNFGVDVNGTVVRNCVYASLVHGPLDPDQDVLFVQTMRGEFGVALNGAIAGPLERILVAGGSPQKALEWAIRFVEEGILESEESDVFATSVLEAASKVPCEEPLDDALCIRKFASAVKADVSAEGVSEAVLSACQGRRIPSDVISVMSWLAALTQAKVPIGARHYTVPFGKDSRAWAHREAGREEDVMGALEALAEAHGVDLDSVFYQAVLSVIVGNGEPELIHSEHNRVVGIINRAGEKGVPVGGNYAARLLESYLASGTDPSKGHEVARALWHYSQGPLSMTARDHLVLLCYRAGRPQEALRGARAQWRREHGLSRAAARAALQAAQECGTWQDATIALLQANGRHSFANGIGDDEGDEGSGDEQVGLEGALQVFANTMPERTAERAGRVADAGIVLPRDWLLGTLKRFRSLPHDRRLAVLSALDGAQGYEGARVRVLLGLAAVDDVAERRSGGQLIAARNPLMFSDLPAEDLDTL